MIPENPLNRIGIVDEGDNAQRGAAATSLEPLDFIDFLNQPGPGGFATGVDFPQSDGHRSAAS